MKCERCNGSGWIIERKGGSGLYGVFEVDCPDCFGVGSLKEVAEPGEYLCGDCDRVERDPIFLDTETCSQCGERLDWESDEPPNPYKHAATPFADNH